MTTTQAIVDSLTQRLADAKWRAEAASLTMTPLELAGLQGEELRRARDFIARANREHDRHDRSSLDEAEIARLLLRPIDEDLIHASVLKRLELDRMPHSGASADLVLRELGLDVLPSLP